MKKITGGMIAFLLSVSLYGQTDSLVKLEVQNENQQEFGNEYYKAAKEEYYFKKINWCSSTKENNELKTIRKKLTSMPTFGTYFSHYGYWETYKITDTCFYYNQDDNLTQKILWRQWGVPGEGGGHIRPDWKIDYIWENGNRLKEIIMSDFNLNGDFYYNVFRMRYYYNYNSDLTQIDYFDWLNSHWELQNRTYYTYNNDEKLTEIFKLNYNYANDQYVSSEKNTISYNALNNSSTDIFCTWDSINHLWINVSKTIYFNDTLNRPLRKDCYSFNSATDSFDIFIRYDFCHSTIDTLSEVIVWTLDTTNHELKKFVKWNLLYGSFGQLSTIENSYWNADCNCFVQGDKRYIFMYYYEYPASALVLPFYYPKSVYQLPYGLESSNFAFQCRCVDEKRFDTISNNWVYVRQQYLDYQTIVETKILDITKQNFIIYPNPASDYITVSLSELADNQVIFKLYDLFGKEVLVSDVSNNQKISVAHLNKGLYVYKINMNGLITTGKLAIE